MRLPLLIFLVSCLQVFAGNPPSDIEFFRQVVSEYRGLKSISYSISYKIKTFDDEDTIRIEGKCKMIRLASDNVYKSKFYMSTISGKFRQERLYDGDKLYVAESGARSGTKFNPSTDGKMGMAGRHDAELINTHFLSKSSSTFDEPDRLKFWNYTLKGQDVSAVEISLADGDEVTGQKFTIHVDRKTRKIFKTTYFVILGDQNQYNEWNFSQVYFNDFSEKELKSLLGKMKSEYAFKPYDPNASPEVVPLAEGSAFPLVAGSGVDGRPFDVTAYKGKILIIDFFYMACHPCVKAIPGLVRLQQKYAGQIAVIGLDPYDHAEKQNPKMPGFISKMKINYPIVFVDQNFAVDCKVEGYPTTYIVDRDGMIVRSIRGYSETLESEIEAAITRLIQK